MYWADKIAREIISSDKHKPYWVDDMKTPSGRIHVGSLRGVIIHDLVYKAVLDAGQKTNFTWVYDDHDPMDALPIYLEKEKWERYLGMPLFKIPSPDKKAESYARFFADEFTEVFNKVGCHPKIIWGSELYLSGRMNNGIKTCLDKVQIIREIYEKTYKKKAADDWYPFHVVCPSCGKESTTKVTGWDGKEVTFECKVNAVEWTKGCGHKGQTSPFSSERNYVGKLSWKLDWAVKWQVIGVTIEGAGKDHMSAGGSHDIARQVCEKVLGYQTPYPIAYEFFLIGGKKMSSSKGLGSSAKEISEVLPPYLLRFLFARTDYREAINFDPVGTMLISDLFDEYDRCRQAYIDGSDEDLARIFVLAQITKVPQKKMIFLPRFRGVAQILQMPNVNIKDYFEKKKGIDLTKEEKAILEERIKYAKVWLEKFAPEEFKFEIKEEVVKTTLPSGFFAKLTDLIEDSKSPEELEKKIYELIKKSNVSTKDAFTEIYKVLIGKTHGPKAAWLIWENKEKALEVFRKISK